MSGAAPDRGGEGRCREHDLALWPDGTCLLCRPGPAPVVRGKSVALRRFGGRSFIVGVVSVASLVLVLFGVRAILTMNAAARASAALAVDGTATEGGASNGLDEARRAVRVRVYTTSWCGSCNQAKQYMRREGIGFSERDIERSDDARAEYTRLGQNVVPVIDVDGQVLVGFDPGRLEGAIERAAERRRAR